MGRNKELRKQIRGHLRVIRKHIDKIDLEYAEPYPDRRNIAKWKEDIERHQREIEKLEAKLPGGKR